MKRRRVLFTHEDLDAATCSIVFQLANRDTMVIYCSNNDIDDKVQDAIDEKIIVPDENIVAFADISPTREMCKKLAELFNPDQLYFWDHHVTNTQFQEEIKDPGNRFKLRMEDSDGVLHCGASVMFQYYLQEDEAENIDCTGNLWRGCTNRELLRKLVWYTRSWDTFAFKQTGDMEAKRLQTLFVLLGMEKFVEMYLNRLTNSDADDTLIDSSSELFVAAAIDKEAELMNDVHLDDLYQGDLDGYDAVFMFYKGGYNLSDMCHIFLKNHPDIDVFITFNLNEGTVMYRTIRDDLNTAKLWAKPNGGGGHPKASGSPLTVTTKFSILSELVMSISNNGEHGLGIPHGVQLNECPDCWEKPENCTCNHKE